MLGSQTLEITIGLLLIYVILSLITTAVNEMIARQFFSRGEMLRKMLEINLNISIEEDKQFKKFSEVFFDSPYLKRLVDSKSQFKSLEWLSLLGKILNPKNLTEFKLNNKAVEKKREQRNFPSYIEPERFSKIIIESLVRISGEEKADVDLRAKLKEGIKKLDNVTGRHLSNLFYIEANGKAELFPIKLELWYNELTDRSIGWYKNYAKRLSLIVGFVIAISLNADTISIIKHLASDDKARAEIVKSAEQMVKQDSIDEDIRELKKSSDTALYTFTKQYYDELNEHKALGLGWPAFPDEFLFSSEMKYKDENSNCIYDFFKAIICRGCDCTNKYNKKETWAKISICKKFFYWFDYALVRLPGWLITAFAISLGAPFWFDLLNKVISIRNAGKRPDSNSGKSGSSPKDVVG